jgi:hypothetical protein
MILTGCAAPDALDAAAPGESIEIGTGADLNSQLPVPPNPAVEYAAPEESEPPARPLPIHFDEQAVIAEALAVSEAVAPIYKDLEFVDDGSGHPVYFPSEADARRIVDIISGMGYPVSSDLFDTENTGPVLAFYEDLRNGAAASVGVYSFNSYGYLSRYCLSCEDGKAYLVTIGLVPENGEAAVSGLSPEKELDVVMVSGGFFFFGSEARGRNGMKDGFRLEPIGDENRALRKKYIDPLMGYLNHNILLSDWDQSDMSALSFNDVFEMLYESQTGLKAADTFGALYDPSNAYNNAVPADIFENTMAQYFDISARQLRDIAVYNSEKNVYAWQRTMNSGYEPSWDVVGSAPNPDGSITLTVHGISVLHCIDCFAVNHVTVMPRPDGSFYYVSNRIEYTEQGRVWAYTPAYVPRIRQSTT